MRRFALIGVILSVLANPSVIYTGQLTQETSAQEAIEAPIKLNFENTQPMEIYVQSPDFAADYEKARKLEAEREIARLKEESQAIATKLEAAGLKSDYAHLYLQAERQTGTPWYLIAAVHKVESGQRGDTTVTSYAGAQGPMQFMPGTWRAYALDGDGDGKALVHDVEDAILTGANYLRANGAARGDHYRALFAYNHADWYVQKVLTVANRLK
jgi:membrane-bound lytic murein transglycosylase B